MASNGNQRHAQGQGRQGIGLVVRATNFQLAHRHQAGIGKARYFSPFLLAMPKP